MVSVDTVAESWAEFALGEVPLPGNPSLWEPRDERVRDALFSLNTSLQPLGRLNDLYRLCLRGPPQASSYLLTPLYPRSPVAGLNSKLPTEHPAKDLCEASFAFVVV